jgi:hypothetical protein
MRTLIRWAAGCYPKAWRERYGAEFDALLEDVSPSLHDVCDVLRDALRARLTPPVEPWVASLAASSSGARFPIIFSVGAHALLLMLVAVTAVGYVTPMPLRIGMAPLPPPFPEPPPQVTDARVFPTAFTLYSSLPLKPADGNVLPLYVAAGVGINFFPVPDIGAVYRQGNVERRVWPGQALESFMVRRTLPEFPRAVDTREAVSVFVEYVVREDGSVKVLRTSGPTPFTDSARSAVEQWVYRPLGYENHRCEVLSRVEVRFDGKFAQSELR